MRLLCFCALVIASVPLAARAQDAVQGGSPAPSYYPSYPTPPSYYPQPAPPPAYVVPQPVAPAPAAPPPPSAPAPVPYVPVPTLGAPTYYVPLAPQPAAQPAPAPVPAAAPTVLYVPPCLEPGQAYRPVLPPGYVIAASHVILATPALPGPDMARTEQLTLALQRVESRMDDIENERIGLGGPIAMMILGYGTAIVSSVAALAAYGSAQDIEHHRDYAHHDITHNGVVNGADETRYRHIAYGFTGVAGFGALVGLLSTAGLARRKAERRAHAAEHKQLAAHRESLRRQLDYGISASPQQMQLSVQGQF